MKRTIAATIAALTIGITPAPAHSAAGRCTQYEQLLAINAPKGGWNIAKMSRTMWRESRCQPTATNRTGHDAGLLQIHPISWRWLEQRLNTPINGRTLLDPTLNIRAAAALCTYWRQAGRSCYRPWRGGA